MAKGVLIDACAVLTETDEVGGPDEKMDRLGVLNKFKAVGWEGPAVVAARSNSGVERE